MMTNEQQLFNTPFEASLRILLLLSIDETKEYSQDEIVTADFISTYAKEFSLADKNLHGDGEFCFAEYTNRRALIKSAIQTLVLDRLLLFTATGNGFSYKISPAGMQYVQKLYTEYAKEYIAVATTVWDYLSTLSNSAALSLVNKTARRNLYGRNA